MLTFDGDNTMRVDINQSVLSEVQSMSGKILVSAEDIYRIIDKTRCTMMQKESIKGPHMEILEDIFGEMRYTSEKLYTESSEISKIVDEYVEVMQSILDDEIF